jgi:hypothetical protein
MNAAMGWVEEQTDRLARCLTSITDAAVRIAYLRHTLLAFTTEQVVELLMAAHAFAETRSARHKNLLGSLSLALAHPTCDQLRRDAATQLMAREERQLARSLSQVPGPLKDEAQRVPDFGMNRPVTLGERKSLARRNDREWIARVIRDPHPDVMKILLLNPLLTETDVVRLCARRPVAGEALREVFQCSRWIVRYPVKVALALNPYTPLDIALQLAPLLRDQDKKRILDAVDLPAELHTACRPRSRHPDALH